MSWWQWTVVVVTGVCIFCTLHEFAGLPGEIRVMNLHLDRIEKAILRLDGTLRELGRKR